MCFAWHWKLISRSCKYIEGIGIYTISLIFHRLRLIPFITLLWIYSFHTFDLCEIHTWFVRVPHLNKCCLSALAIVHRKFDSSNCNFAVGNIFSAGYCIFCFWKILMQFWYLFLTYMYVWRWLCYISFGLLISYSVPFVQYVIEFVFHIRSCVPNVEIIYHVIPCLICFSQFSHNASNLPMINLSIGSFRLLNDWGHVLSHHFSFVHFFLRY